MEEMNRVYLAGAVTGRSRQETEAEFATYKGLVSILYDFDEIINPLEIGCTGKDYEADMQLCFDKLRTCDTIVMLPSWTQSPGAIRERALAQELGLTIIDNL